MSNRKEKLHQLFVQKVQEIIKANYQDERFGLPCLCETLCLSRSQVYRKVFAVTGSGPAEMIKAFRLEKALILIRETDKSINEIAYEVGFGDASYFTKAFKIHYGMVPSQVEMTL